MEMKTVFDLPKPYKPSENDKIYTVHNTEDIFEAILDALNINPTIEFIEIQINDFINNRSKELYESCHKHGWYFNIPYYSKHSVTGIIRFRNLTKWVYFKNNQPIWFDTTGSGTDTPSHLCGFPNKIYETLDFDRFEKISY